MKVPYYWLKEYVDLTLTPEELADALTMAGVEVGAIDCFAPLDDRFLVGQIERIKPHPNSDKLQVVQVNSGKAHSQVVCGAWNIQENDYIALALPGAVLPGGQEVQETEIKGITSQGMILSADELGLEIIQQKTGVLILEENNIGPGGLLSQALFINQPVLELELTPNRSDCLGLLGVAREVAAITGATVTLPVPEFQEDSTVVTANVEVVEPELCFRYTAREMKNIQVKPSPLNMQLKLLAAGIRPINNIVDVTNYVMWETGQPMHAFDLEKVKDETIKVRRAESGETLVTLDGMERKLDPDVLVIADSTESIGLAGVMGGENTEITETTTEMLLEAACFDPVNVRKTARKFNLPSDASQRFEKGVDREGIVYAQNRAVELMQKTSGGTISRGIIDQYPYPWKAIEVDLETSKVEQYLGYVVSFNEIKNNLEKLGLEVLEEQTQEAKGNPGKLTVRIPSSRQDINLDVDLIEEVARLKGYDRVPTTLPEGVITTGRPSKEQRLLSKIDSILISCGLQEVITFSFMNPRFFDQLKLRPDDHRRDAVYLKNPLTEEQEIMRTTLIPNMLQVLQYNFNRQSYDLFLFERGAVFTPSSEQETLPREKEMLTLAITGKSHPEHWQHPGGPVDFFYLKGILETLLARLGIEKAHWEKAEVPFLHPSRGAKLFVEDQELGLLGALHPQLVDHFELKQEVYFAEIPVEPLCEFASLSPSFEALPRYPAILRDAAFVVPESVSSAELQLAIEKHSGELLEKIVLFDVYKGEQIPEGRISLAFALTFRHPERTLKDSEVDRIMVELENKLQDNYSATLRRQ